MNSHPRHGLHGSPLVIFVITSHQLQQSQLTQMLFMMTGMAGPLGKDADAANDTINTSHKSFMNE
jgi:hypothetical protein